ncbi:hypothetical protein C0583_04775 [Candidatus Parcubacteria bacterium]|nr:MAG: hypothetical protein C0583_04775 [Candidatus Parcubacteria bacterium]
MTYLNMLFEKALFLFDKFVVYSENLSPLELWFVYAIGFLVFLYAIYRTLGIGGLVSVTAIVFFAWVWISGGFWEKWQERQANEAKHMQLIQEELRKDPLDG